MEAPAELPPGAPLVLVFHGTGGSAKEVQRDCGFSPLVEKHGFVAIYPEATRETNPDNVQQFQVGYAFQRGRSVDDVAFVHQLVDRLVRDLKLDRRSVFATGMSNGGDMCYFLASQPEPIVRAIGPVAGTMMVSWGQNLKPKGRTSVLAVNSRDDDITLWDGDLQNKDGWGAYYGTEAVVDLWVRGLSLEPDKTADLTGGHELREGLTLRRWCSGHDDTEFRMYQFRAIGHTWPTHLGDERVSTAEEIWQFFDRHRPDPE